MKTLHLTNAWHETSGGIATFYRALLRSAEILQQHVTIVVPGAADSIERTSDFGCVYSVKSPRSPLNRNYRLLMPQSYLRPGGRIHQILRSERPDLVEVSDKYSLPYLAGLLRRGWLKGLEQRPTVVGLSCERMDDNVAAYLTRRSAGVSFCRAYMKWLYFPMCDQHIAVSTYTAEELERASRGHAKRRGVWICPMGVDCETFRPERRTPEARATLLGRAGAGPNSALLLYCGRLAPEKNVDLLLQTLAALRHNPNRECHLLVAGDGPLRERLVADAARSAPGRAHFLGHVRDRDELADLFANCDAFIHPNPREPFGIAPLEAMASGVPLVAPSAGGVISYASAANSWLEPPEAGSFAAAVRAILNEPAERARRTERARQVAERHSWASIAVRYLRLYGELQRVTVGDLDAATETPAFYSTRGNRFGLELRHL